ncbi:MAG: amidohydrolase, partial [Geminicoccaceae bacterium]
MQATEKIYKGGTVLTMDAENRQTEAVAIANDRILDVGSEADILTLANERTEHIDLGGRTMIPAFIDPHGHFPESGFCALHRVDLMCPPLG